MGNGGPGRNRTDVRGFAVLCMATLPPGRKRPDQEGPDVAAVFGERTYRADPARWSSMGRPRRADPLTRGGCVEFGCPGGYNRPGTIIGQAPEFGGRTSRFRVRGREGKL